MKTAAHLVALFLESEGIGTLGTDIFINSEPATPDNTITVYDTGSDRPKLLGGQENTGYREQDFNVQIRVRNKDTQAAVLLLQDMRVLLHKMQSFTDNGQVLKGAWLNSAGLPLGFDDNRRVRYTDNWRVKVGRAKESYSTLVFEAVDIVGNVDGWIQQGNVFTFTQPSQGEEYHYLCLAAKLDEAPEKLSITYNFSNPDNPLAGYQNGYYSGFSVGMPPVAAWSWMEWEDGLLIYGDYWDGNTFTAPAPAPTLETDITVAYSNPDNKLSIWYDGIRIAESELSAPIDITHALVGFHELTTNAGDTVSIRVVDRKIPGYATVTTEGVKP